MLGISKVDLYTGIKLVFDLCMDNGRYVWGSSLNVIDFISDSNFNTSRLSGILIHMVMIFSLNFIKTVHCLRTSIQAFWKLSCNSPFCFIYYITQHSKSIFKSSNFGLINVVLIYWIFWIRYLKTLLLLNSWLGRRIFRESVTQ